MYAVISCGGKQYKVTEGQTLEVDKIDKKVGEKFILPDVLLVVDKNLSDIGQPKVAGASVSAKVIDQIKGPKIHVFKYKSKVRYRRHTGFRPLMTKVMIEKINIAKKNTAKE
ncbi:MAG: 50S ribosomal protein L21 [Candidatus Gottesmanbacteria bacterium]